MSAIEVQRLKLSCRSEARERTRFAIEDGLRTSLPDESRLVLIRRMQVKGEIASTHPARRNKALREGWLGAITGARHGGDDGAGNANCVWFASREEAETVFLGLLLAGRSVEAWYWRLALPEWRGQSFRAWLPECLAGALGESSPRHLARIAQCCILGGATELLLDSLDQTAKAGSPLGLWTVLASAASERPEAEIVAAAVTAAPFAERLASTISPPLRRAILKLCSSGMEARSAAFALVEALLLKASPATALSPPLLSSIVSRTIEMLLIAGPARRDPSSVRRPDTGSMSELDALPSATVLEPFAVQERHPFLAENVDQTRDVDPKDTDVMESRPLDASSEPIAPPEWQRLESAHAGLWLIVPSLIDLGFREWIFERPDLLGDNPGRQLFEEISAHYRIGLGDPALVPFEGAFRPKSANDWARQWRSGLDRWLRRVARCRLHDLVGRQGLLELGDRQLLVHFPAGTADLRLRRRALDRDPGWTDWLGLSIRYDFKAAEFQL